MRRDPAAQLRSATFGYVSGNTVGDLTLDIDIIRRGRAMTTTDARITQNGAHAAAPERREVASLVRRSPLTLSVRHPSPATMAVRHFCHTPRAASTEL